MAAPRRPRPVSAKESPDMPAGESGNPFDLDQLRQLVELMDEHGLTEVSLKKGGEHWRLRRGGHEIAMPMYAPPAAIQPAAVSPPPSTHRAAPEHEPSPPAATENLVEIKSPTVGTFYASPSPDEPAFVSVGSKVTQTTIVCLIEAMKVFNQIPADVSGTIAAVLVKNNDAVEYGQPLFKVRL